MLIEERLNGQLEKERLKLIYVDPEGYINEHGKFISYPLESPQNEDILIRMTAQQFTDSWRSAFR